MLDLKVNFKVGILWFFFIFSLAVSVMHLFLNLMVYRSNSSSDGNQEKPAVVASEARYMLLHGSVH